MTTTPLMAASLTIPPLENGDKLTRWEFERRYQGMPHLKKAELIEGIVYMASPLRFESHAEPHANIIGWLALYKAATPGVRLGDNATVRLDIDNEPQPDALLRIDKGGQSTISQDDYVEGAPELIVEIAASSASYDVHQKLNVYRRNQVQEYLVWRFYEQEFDWFLLQTVEYIKLEPDSDGIIRSQIFPGLWLDKNALLMGDLGKVLVILQRGLETAEHRDFVNKLTSDRSQV
ncbi:Uma2 family endonuclease [Microcystis aeruginosa CS-558/01A06]|uniref:Uma2 family endonuclease n=1 Tax=Microcystis aeruginosa BLCC-F108 TaxID=2755317 RepID=A0A841UF06_MICAE|nr:MULTISPECIES: Uma2 family endonuclease [Microcystis]MBC1189392.1 Uma2 family endonuclease [Microcystis aeruginosa BLCC-F108]MCA2591016.1 Uma2 family endonuclease [Microcystis sp. M31BS1]MDB9409241.1 Uma2 family endonuclease [Microcystis aeruginosa CS-558/01A06]